jgi:hypothetical protein
MQFGDFKKYTYHFKMPYKVCRKDLVAMCFLQLHAACFELFFVNIVIREQARNHMIKSQVYTHGNHTPRTNSLGIHT